MAQDTIEMIGKLEEYSKGKLIRIIRQPMRLPADKEGNRKEVNFEFAERTPGVRTLVTNNKYILLNKEWRAEVGDWDYRLPGGKVYDLLDDYIKYRDDKKRILKDAKINARKELLEESGLEYSESQFNMIHKSVCGSSIIWDLYYYQVEIHEELPKLKEIFTEEGEHTIPEWVSIKDLKSYCIDGKINEDRSIAVLFKYIIK